MELNDNVGAWDHLVMYLWLFIQAQLPIMSIVTPAFAFTGRYVWDNVVSYKG